MEHFRVKIRKRLESLGWGQRDLERASGVHYVTLSRYFTGKSELEPESLGKVVKALGGRMESRLVWGRKPRKGHS